MATKNKPGEFDCYAAAEDDEPLFTLLARDEDAPELVEDWCRKRLAHLMASELTREQLHRGVRKVAEALVCANNMRDWRAHRTPDFYNVLPLDQGGGLLSELFGRLDSDFTRKAMEAAVCGCPDHKATLPDEESITFRTAAEIEAERLVGRRLATSLDGRAGGLLPRGWATGLHGRGEKYGATNDGSYIGLDRRSEPHPSSECAARGCGTREDRTDPEGGIPGRWHPADCGCARCCSELNNGAH